MSVDRIWFEIKNMPGHRQVWEWMEEVPDGEYLLRDEVIALIEQYVTDPPTLERTKTVDADLH